MTAPAPRAAAPAVLVKGRPSDAARRGVLGSYGFRALIPRQNAADYRAREGRTVLDTLRVVRDRDPDAAQAVSNMLLLMGQGYRVAALKPGGEDTDEAATAYLREFDARVGEEYGGGMDAVIDVLNLTLVTQGAMAAELEIAPGLRAVADVHPVDPAVVVFRREEGTGKLLRGVMAPRTTPGADADGFLPLSPRQFRYMPLHPDVDNPYGRSPLLAALTAVFFKIELLEDLKAVLHNQGYPRLDVTIIEEMVMQNAPADLRGAGREGDLAAFVRTFMDDLGAAYVQLEPDDTFIHPDSVTVNYATPGGAAVNADAVARILDTQIVAGLKQLPILLGRNEGNAQSHASIQWRIYMLLIEALQRRTKRVLEWVHTTALNVAGYQAHAHVTFDTEPTSERLVDAQAFQAEVRAWTQAVAQGFADSDEAANDLFGHPAVVAAPPKEGTDAPPA